MPGTLQLTRDAFVDLLGSLDGEAFAAFVADLWRETGWKARVEGREVVVAREDGTIDRRLRVEPDERGSIERLLRIDHVPTPDGADAVVVSYPSSAGESAEVIDVSELYDRLLFAVDRDTCRDLCRRHFGRDVEPVPDREGTTPPLAARVGRLSDAERPRLLFAGVALVVLALAVTLLVGGTPGRVDRSATAPAGEMTPVPVGSTVTGVGSGPTTTPDPTLTPTPAIGDLDPGPLRWNRTRYLDAVPTCNRSVREVIQLYVGALRLATRNGSSGLDTAWRFIDARVRPRFPEFRENIEEWVPPVLFEFDRARFGEGGPVQDPHPGRDRLVPTTVSQEVVFVRNGTERRFEFIVSKRTHGTAEGCWQVQSIYPVAGSGSGNTSTGTNSAVR